MASVSDGEQQSYESYNNIIVDELGEIKNELTSLLSVSSDGIRIDTRPITDKLEEVRNLVEEARKAADAQRDLAAADEIAKLKQTIADQKDTQNAMLELMNKMIAKLDKQEEQTARLTDEISGTRDESVKKDIEDIKYTLGVMQGAEDKDADADLEESIGKLKAELSQMAGIIGSAGQRQTGQITRHVRGDWKTAGMQARRFRWLQRGTLTRICVKRPQMCFSGLFTYVLCVT